VSALPDEAMAIVRAGVGDKFHAVLRDAGVFKSDVRGQEAFGRFLRQANLVK